MSKLTAANNPVQCTLKHLETTADAHRFKVILHNGSPQTIHLLRTDRMPYRIQTKDNGIVLSWSIQAPHPDMDYLFLEVPLTEALAAGATREETVELARPIQVRDHLAGRARDPDRKLANPLNVHAEVGFVPYAIDKKGVATRQYERVLQDQVLSQSQTLSIGPP